MNREIKFRAWDGKKMFYEDFAIRSDSLFYNLSCATANDDPVVMQYTDRKDIDRRSIYEHDILHSVSENNEIAAGVVIYLFGCAGLQVIDMQKMKGAWVNEWIPFSSVLWQDQKFKVVGNVYENPNLINDFEALKKFQKL